MPPGLVDEISATLLGDLMEVPLVALGGGRVIDTAKAIGGVTGLPVAAIPTTLSGAELTPFHRTPAGVEGAHMVRPSLVVADPLLMASQPATELAASAMNALAHGMEALYTPLANPIAERAALRGAELIAATTSLALGALSCADGPPGSTGFAVHHATCQLLVRTAGSPHAADERGDAAALRRHDGRPRARRDGRAGGRPRRPGRRPRGSRRAAPRSSRRAAATRASPRSAWRSEHLPPVAAAVMQHPALGNTPDPPDEEELLALLRDRALDRNFMRRLGVLVTCVACC